MYSLKRKKNHKPQLLERGVGGISWEEKGLVLTQQGPELLRMGGYLFEMGVGRVSLGTSIFSAVSSEL